MHSPEDISMRMARVYGQRVSYRQTGSGPPVVLLHGLIGSARNWDLNLDALSESHTVYAVDLPNMGDSARGPVDATQKGMVAALVRWMDAVGIDRADLVGSSHGGALSMALAARYPSRVRRMVLFAPANPFCRNGANLMRFYLSVPGELFARSIPHLPVWVHAEAYRRIYGDRRRVRRAMLSGYTRGLNQQTVRHVLSIVRHWWPDMNELRAELPRLVGTPTLLVWGSRDTVVGLKSACVLAEALQAELRILEGVGHLPYEEVPELVNPWLLEFLNEDMPLSEDRLAEPQLSSSGRL